MRQYHDAKRAAGRLHTRERRAAIDRRREEAERLLVRDLVAMTATVAAAAAVPAAAAKPGVAHRAHPRRGEARDTFAMHGDSLLQSLLPREDRGGPTLT